MLSRTPYVFQMPLLAWALFYAGYFLYTTSEQWVMSTEHKRTSKSTSSKVTEKNLTRSVRRCYPHLLPMEFWHSQSYNLTQGSEVNGLRHRVINEYNYICSPWKKRMIDCFLASSFTFTAVKRLTANIPRIVEYGDETQPYFLLCILEVGGEISILPGWSLPEVFACTRNQTQTQATSVGLVPSS